ncbi:MAG: leucine--tRNA ligase, partial [Candidatus Aenigmatarchaeota archaeon]
EKWQKAWEDNKVFEDGENSNKPKYYVLEMFHYPSGRGLHTGHAFNYSIGDIYARFKRMKGFNVLYPMGYDSFGLPAENAAIKAKSHPKEFTEKAIKNFIKQQKALGLSYDWSRMIMSHKPDYYKWDQWIFLKMYEKGLVYRKKAAVNYCSKCKTVLANEQVHDGKCWRHKDTDVEIRFLEQWYIKITDYAEELLKGIDELKEWPEDVKTMQRNWIGKSEGAIIEFPIENSNEKIEVFTTRPDTFFGITFLVYAPEHPKVMELVKGTKYEKKVKEFIKKVLVKDRFTRTAMDKEKEGMFIGRYAINPITKERIPIYIANFVLYEYGTGAIIAVPAHDQRDFEFAKKYNIPIKVVINPPDYELNPEKMTRAYEGDGIMVNSYEFNGMNNRDAIPEIIKFLEKHKCGRKAVKYKLRDWLISRQRFWGCPIPIVYCEKCGIVPVPEKDLPVKLPEDYKFTIGEGNPLEHCEEFVNTTCPKCGGKARRETDTMDTFIDSSWYFLRYCDPKNDKLPFSKEKAEYWMPIDVYIGGKEHATMHLIYFRFFTKFLRDIGMIDIDEPAKKLFNQGMLQKNGVVMSKSKGNVVLPEDIAEKYGIDTARFFLLFVASPDKDMEWSKEGIEGSYKFLNKLYSLIEKELTDEISVKEESKLNKTIKLVSDAIENFKFNIALIHIMKFVNFLSKQEKISRKCLKDLCKIITPFVPHIAEEMWEKLGNKSFVSLEKWPEADESKINPEVEYADELIEKVKEDIRNILNLLKVKASKIRIIVADEWKFNFLREFKKQIKETRDRKELIERIVPKFKEYSKEIVKMINFLLKDESRIPSLVLSQEKEINILKEASKELKEIFNAEIVIEKDIKEGKAKQAMPGKPAIIIENA